MTPTETKSAAEVMLAWADGKHIEHRCRSAGVWGEVDRPHWNWETGEYRIKPEPREWWLVFHRDDAAQITAHCCTGANVFNYSPPGTTTIHVREVMEEKK